MRVGRMIKPAAPPVTVPAPAGATGGKLHMFGSFVGLIEVATDAGQPAEADVEGEAAYAKAPAEVIGLGDKLYLKADLSVVTKTPLAGMKFVGCATEAAGNGATEVRFKFAFGMAEYTVP